MARSGPCAAVPSFDRLNYYYGQLLSAPHFLAEQAYFREKLKLHNRCLHGYGVVCGLEVTVESPPDPCYPPKEPEAPPPPAGGDEARKIEEETRKLREEFTKVEDPDKHRETEKRIRK